MMGAPVTGRRGCLMRSGAREGMAMPGGERVSGQGGSAAAAAWRSRSVELAHMLVVPQGFTVAVAGSIAVCVGRHGFAGPFAVWLFVAGASLGYCLVIVATGAVRRPIEQPGGIVGAALLNVSA